MEAARNIQRGRDHGLRSYNEYRAHFGLDVSCTWDYPPEGVSEDNWARLAGLYNSPSDVELFVGGLAEHPTRRGATVGPTFARILEEQFMDYRLLLVGRD